MSRQQVTRVAAFAVLIIGVLALLIAIVPGGDGYTVHARLSDASQLVKGSQVQVAGEPIGSVADLRLTDDGQAEAVLEIDGGEYTPLHRGTHATVRTIGLAGIASRFVELAPGPLGAPEIPDEGVLDLSETTPMVDIDAILDSLDARTRADIQSIIQDAAKVGADGAADDLNRALAYINPTFSQARLLSEELARDRFAVERLIDTSASVVSALASRSADLEQGVSGTAATLRAIAGERVALGDALGRAPDVLEGARGTLRRLRGTLGEVRPALREARPVAAPLARLLRALGPVTRETTPIVGDLRALFPAFRRALPELPRLERVGVPAFRSTTSTLGKATPIFAGIRPYTPDLIGAIGALGARTATSYDANGHFLRDGLTQPGDSGLLAPLLGIDFEGAHVTRDGLVARCPGAIAEPARDRSNPWIPDPTICNPEHNHR